MHQVIVIATEEYPVVNWTNGHKTFVLILKNHPIRTLHLLDMAF
jgi:hypothetical protein